MITVVVDLSGKKIPFIEGIINWKKDNPIVTDDNNNKAILSAEEKNYG